MLAPRSKDAPSNRGTAFEAGRATKPCALPFARCRAASQSQTRSPTRLGIDGGSHRHDRRRHRRCSGRSRGTRGAVRYDIAASRLPVGRVAARHRDPDDHFIRGRVLDRAARRASRPRGRRSRCTRSLSWGPMVAWAGSTERTRAMSEDQRKDDERLPAWGRGGADPDQGVAGPLAAARRGASRFLDRVEGRSRREPRGTLGRFRRRRGPQAGRPLLEATEEPKRSLDDLLG